jgi:DNA-binding response OmpR family regulator
VGLQDFGVALVRWPDELDRVERLRTAGVPRLLLVGEDASAPLPVDSLEDWIRLPVREDELRARVTTLRSRARGPVAAAPTVDEDGLLWYRGQWIALSPIERELAAALAERYGAVVHRETLVRRAWNGRRTTTGNAFAIRMGCLRRRVTVLGLEIRTVRGRGYLLQSRGSDEAD